MPPSFEPARAAQSSHHDLRPGAEPVPRRRALTPLGSRASSRGAAAAHAGPGAAVRSARAPRSAHTARGGRRATPARAGARTTLDVARAGRRRRRAGRPTGTLPAGGRRAAVAVGDARRARGEARRPAPPEGISDAPASRGVPASVASLKDTSATDDVSADRSARPEASADGTSASDAGTSTSVAEASKANASAASAGDVGRGSEAHATRHRGRNRHQRRRGFIADSKQHPCRDGWPSTIGIGSEPTVIDGNVGHVRVRRRRSDSGAGAERGRRPDAATTSRTPPAWRCRGGLRGCGSSGSGRQRARVPRGPRKSARPRGAAARSP